MTMSLHKRIWVRVVILTGILGLLGAGIIWYWHVSGPPIWSLRTIGVQRGDLLATVSATGTIEPEEVVDVGAQVVGMIKEFGRDPSDSTRPIDYLSLVEPGMVLARIDDRRSRHQHRIAERASAWHV
jgi:HlyD family secretion protein